MRSRRFLLCCWVESIRVYLRFAPLQVVLDFLFATLFRCRVVDDRPRVGVAPLREPLTRRKKLAIQPHPRLRRFDKRDPRPVWSSCDGANRWPLRDTVSGSDGAIYRLFDISHRLKVERTPDLFDYRYPLRVSRFQLHNATTL